MHILIPGAQNLEDNPFLIIVIVAFIAFSLTFLIQLFIATPSVFKGIPRYVTVSEEFKVQFPSFIWPVIFPNILAPCVQKMNMWTPKVKIAKGISHGKS